MHPMHVQEQEKHEEEEEEEEEGFPVRLESQCSLCVGTPSGRGGLGEMVGCALFRC